MQTERFSTFLLWIAAFAFPACSGDDGRAPGLSCEPDSIGSCACTDGSPGTQTCDADGRFEVCTCGTNPAPPLAGGAPNAGGGGTGPFAGGSPGEGGTPATGGLPATGGDSPGGGAGGSDPGGPPIPSTASCNGFSLPPVADYGARGPFTPVTIANTGPNGQYTMVRPQELGENGFKHPPTTWGNGITTTPAAYVILLDTIASHGFVVIASDSTNVTAQMMTAGLDWLIAQNDAPGDIQGKLATDCAVTIGYSLGGGAAITSGNHTSVKTTVSFHGLQGPAENLQAPLLLLTSTNDGFVTKAGYTVPTYERSTVVPTVMATLEVPGAVPDFAGHLIPINDAGPERAPAIAWLRLWIYADDGARPYFYGSDCILCRTPWVDIQRKNASF